MPKVLLDEPKINVIGNYSPSGHDASRVVDVNGIALTVKENHGTVTGIIEPLAYDEQNKYIRKDGCVGTITTDGSSPKHNNRVIEFDWTEINSNDNLNNIRIRKLTPKECFRLMGFSDDDFEKAKYYSEEEVEKLNLRSLKKYKNLPPDEKIERISNSQLYKQAGNSIVVDVLYYIFKELYITMPYLFENLRVSSYFSGIGAFEKALDRLYECLNSNSFHQSLDLTDEEKNER